MDTHPPPPTPNLSSFLQTKKYFICQNDATEGSTIAGGAVLHWILIDEERFIWTYALTYSLLQAPVFHCGVSFEVGSRSSGSLWPTEKWAFLVAQLEKNRPAMQETPVRFLGQEDPLEKGQATHPSILGLPWWLRYKDSTCNAGDLGSIPRTGRFPGKRNGYPLQYSCLENSMDRGAWQDSPWGHKESDMTERLSLRNAVFLVTSVNKNVSVTEIPALHCEFLSPKGTQERECLWSSSNQTIAPPYSESQESSRCGKHRILDPDSWDTYERNDFSGPRFLQ